jgi:hypothetical protein
VGTHRRFASPRNFQFQTIGLLPLMSGDEKTTAVQQSLYQRFLSENIPRPTL